MVVPQCGSSAAVVLVAVAAGCGAVPFAESVVDAVAPSAVFALRLHPSVRLVDAPLPAVFEAADVPGSVLQLAPSAVADTSDRLWVLSDWEAEAPGGALPRWHAHY